jgi:hypothetical protein
MSAVLTAPPPHVTLADIRAAAARIQGAVLRTPTIRCETLSRVTGASIFLKLDNLQATGAFKERGAANRIALLSAREREAGVIAMSAGNHAQAVARHAALAGIRATIVMPKYTPATKVTRTEGWGARVVLHGETLAEAAAHALDLSLREGLFFLHPYDDPGVIAGQGTAALEMLEDAPRIRATLEGDLKRLVDEKAAVLTGWMRAGRLARTDPWHLIFAIWSTTQHYADFDVQVRAVLGPDRGGAGRFEDAARFLETLFVEGLRPKAG